MPDATIVEASAAVRISFSVIVVSS
jgi:hypothetical protein